LQHGLQTPLLEYGRKSCHNLAAAPKSFDAQPMYEDALENRNICTHYQTELVALHVLDTVLFFETGNYVNNWDCYFWSWRTCLYGPKEPPIFGPGETLALKFM
jgi:hypothetical protein